MRIIDVLADIGHCDTIVGIAEHHEVVEHWQTQISDESRCNVRLVVRPEKQQTVIDALQQALDKTENWRIIINPVEGVLPRPQDQETKQPTKQTGRTREELYHEVATSAKLNSNYLLLVIFSTIVATIGLLESNVAVIIGAMVIAPLLGPNIALALGTALGDKPLIAESLKSNFFGLLVACLLAYTTGLILDVDLNSVELMSRTDVGLAGVILAFVSGAAGVLSLTTGLSSALVGVMVAVALLPPTVTLGLMLSIEEYTLAIGAGLLLAVNIVSVNLAAKLVFLFKGVNPRTWYEKKRAKKAMLIYSMLWVVILALLVLLINIYHSVNITTKL